MNSIYKLKGGFSFAMHGAGAFSGCTHTNSREAFVYWKNKGIKVFEIDVGVDENYEEGIAFAHLMKQDVDWLHKEVNPNQVKPDYKLNRIYPKSTRGLSILLLSELFGYMRDNPNLLIMLDFWGGWDGNKCRKLSKFIIQEVGNDTTLWERLLIEVYTVDMINAVREVIPNANLIFGESVFSKWYTVNEIMSYDISFVSFPRSMAKKNISKFHEYVNHGFIIFSLSTSNFGWKKWKDRGVNVNIIDIKYDSIFEIIKHIILSARHKANVFLVSIEYYGFREVITKIINKILK